MKMVSASSAIFTGLLVILFFFCIHISIPKLDFTLFELKYVLALLCKRWSYYDNH